MLNYYKTVNKEAQAEIEEKKSKFISYVKPVNSDEEARAFIDGIKKMNYNATHNVFAYQVGDNNEIQRYSDDGEPSGTAGLPVLDVLRGQDIKNTVIVVTRYFGGTLLGTGGLVRAYGRSAKAGVEAAEIIEKVLFSSFSVQVDYTLSGKVEYELLQRGHIIKDTLYTDKVTFIVYVHFEKEESFEKEFVDITGGNACIKSEEKLYGKLLNGKLIV